MAAAPSSDSPPLEAAEPGRRGWGGHRAAWRGLTPAPSLLRGAYDLNFQGQKAAQDMVVHYPYEKLGCPLLVHYDTPWKPVVEL